MSEAKEETKCDICQAPVDSTDPAMVLCEDCFEESLNENSHKLSDHDWTDHLDENSPKH